MTHIGDNLETLMGHYTCANFGADWSDWLDNQPENLEYSKLIKLKTLHRMLIGRDQVTAERVKGAKILWKNSTSSIGRLEVVPVSEDWQAKVCLVQALKSNIGPVRQSTL